MNSLSNFKVEEQVGSRLCWAAVSLAIAKHYGNATDYSQIDFAKQVMGIKFNQFCPPAKALSHLKILKEIVNRPLTKSEIKNELKYFRPIAACMKHFVGWHLVVIYGFRGNQLLIADSLHGTTKWDIETFTTAYFKSYSWTHSYKTSRIE